MSQRIRDRITTLVVVDPAMSRPQRRELAKQCFVHADSGQVLIVSVSVRRLGDLATTKGVIDAFEYEVPKTALEMLAGDAARLAKIWNWRLQARSRAEPVGEKEVEKFIGDLGLQLVEGKVVDRASQKPLGKVEEVELLSEQRFYSPNPGCFWMRSGNNRRVVPGFFGAWTRAKGWTETRACTSSGGMSSSRQAVDAIGVTVWNQVGAYARKTQTNASYVVAEDWEYCWLWEVEVGGAHVDSDHWARWGEYTLTTSL